MQQCLLLGKDDKGDAMCPSMHTNNGRGDDGGDDDDDDDCTLRMSI